jgi:tetratricopeptide (TPR) repeat protein/tRNA A-37 threonylcarbamoyl transferase component Bud32
LREAGAVHHPEKQSSTFVRVKTGSYSHVNSLTISPYSRIFQSLKITCPDLLTDTEKMTKTTAFLLSLALSLSYAQEIDSVAVLRFDAAMKSKSFEEKIRLLQEAIELSPGYQEALYQLGVSFYHRGSYQEAIEYLEQVRQLDRDGEENRRLFLRNAYTFRAQELNSEKNYENAAHFAREAITIDRTYAPALTILGFIQANINNSSDAISLLAESIRRNDQQDLAWQKLGELYMNQESFTKAIAAFEKALDLNPGLSEAKAHVNISRRRNRPEEWVSRYQALADAGLDLESSMEFLKKALENNPNDPLIASKLRLLDQEHNYQLGVTALNNGRFENAQRIFLGLEPGYRDVVQKLEDIRAELAGQETIEPASFVESVTAEESLQVTETATPPPAFEFEALADSSQQSSERSIANRTFSPYRRQPQDSVVFQVDSIEALEGVLQDVKAKANPFSKAISEDMRRKLPWIAGAVGSVLILGILVIRLTRKKPLPLPNRKSLQTTLTGDRLKKRPPIRSHKTDNDTIFSENVASVTPIQFDAVDTSEILDQNSRKADDVKSDPDLLSLQETRTIIGGIQRLKRIGRYIIEKEIGRGSMGAVYKAWDPKLDRTVVIKKVEFDLLESKASIQRLKDRLYREARAAGSLNHHNIVIVYDVDEEADFSFIVMEFLEGEDLDRVLEKKVKLPPREALSICKQICSALAFAHENDIVHRDIKPSNIVFTKKRQIKVADFGIAKLPRQNNLTQTGNIVGTPFYMSPEQIEGRAVDGRSDIFSTGVVLYQMLTGKRPFDGTSIPTVVYKIIHQVPVAPTSLEKGLPQLLDDIIIRALAKDPGNRYENAEQMSEDLERAEKVLV